MSYDLGSITIFMEFSIWLQMYAGFLLSRLFPPSLQNVLLFVNEGIVRVGENVYFCYNESIYNCSGKKNIVHVEFSMKYFNMTHLQLQQNSSEIRGLCFMKCHLPFFQRKKTQIIFFIFHFEKLWILDSITILVFILQKYGKFCITYYKSWFQQALFLKNDKHIHHFGKCNTTG